MAIQVRKVAKEKYGGKKRAHSLVVEDALMRALSRASEISTVSHAIWSASPISAAGATGQTSQ
ncbi:MAG: hypothetical protein ACYC7D_10710 [Nitrososphaerales archaeon]